MTDFWGWALERYARPGVEALLIRMQDEQGQCVPYLLWAAWGPSPSRLEQGAGLARVFEDEVIAPLRQVRRRIRREAALHDQIKAAELAAEKVVMQALEGLGPAGSPADMQGQLVAAVQAWGNPADGGDLKRLATLLR